MNIKNKIIAWCATFCAMVAIVGCTVSYSFTGASIPAEAMTFSVEQIVNVSTMVVPTLSSTLTDELTDRFASQTRLAQVREGGDLAFSGEITNYTSVPVAVTGDEYAALNRLTITVRIRYSNKLQPESDFERTFSAYQDYDATVLMQVVEPTLIPEIVEDLVDDIFNASVSNWE